MTGLFYWAAVAWFLVSTTVAMRAVVRDGKASNLAPHAWIYLAVLIALAALSKYTGH